MNKRQKEVLQAQLDSEKAVLKRLEENYQDALAEINSKIELLMARQDADMQHVIYQIEYQKALKSQVKAILEQLHSNEFETVSEYLAKSYEDGFVGTMYDLQGQGIPLVFPIDQKQVVEAIQQDTKLSESLYTTMGHDITDLKKKITGEISRGLSSGQMYSEIARNVSSWANIPKNNAMRIARTEAHRIQCKATMDAQYKAKSKGADVVKQWDASLDGKTRDSHRELDGQIRELDEPFEVNGHKAMQPGGFGIPEEDINCRCALLQRAKWALGGEYTKWSEDAPIEISDDGTTQFVDLSDAKNLNEFKKQYNQVTERVRQGAQMMNDEDTLEKDGKSNTIELPDTSNCHHATKEQYTAEKKSCKKNVSKEDVAQIMKHEKEDGSPGGYVATHNYSNINSNLRGDGFTGNKLDNDDIKTIESLRRAIQANTLDDDYILTRYVNADYLTSVFGIKGKYNSRDDFSTLTNSITQVGNPYVVKTEIPRITDELKQWIGKQIEPDKAFVSTSMLKDKNIMQDKSVLFNIKAPKGTHAYIPENRKESECILGENTIFIVENVEYSTIAHKWIFDVVVAG